jgi:hypothetical protein
MAAAQNPVLSSNAKLAVLNIKNAINECNKGEETRTAHSISPKILVVIEIINATNGGLL